MLPVPPNEGFPPSVNTRPVHLKGTAVEAEWLSLINKNELMHPAEIWEPLAIYILFFRWGLFKEAFFCQFLVDPEFLALEKSIDCMLRAVIRCPENNRSVAFDGKAKRFP
jgi:hypothetical protein